MTTKRKTNSTSNRRLLVQGNAKLGANIWCFNIPAGYDPKTKTTYCPGRTDLCDSRCYAQRGMFCMPSVQSTLKDNYRASRQKDFVKRIVAEIKAIKPSIVRIHSSGDMYSPRYAASWHKIAKACRDTMFYTYTRSWRDRHTKPTITTRKLRKVLFKMAKLKNFKLWFSVDAESGLPPANTPPEVRIAYMMISASDRPANNSSLVFRDYPMRGESQRYIDGRFVCPPENGERSSENVTCSRCKVCWGKHPVPMLGRTPRRLALPVLPTTIVENRNNNDVNATNTKNVRAMSATSDGNCVDTNNSV